jgi:hypothetical protein
MTKLSLAFYHYQNAQLQNDQFIADPGHGFYFDIALTHLFSQVRNMHVYCPGLPVEIKSPC